MKKLKEKLYQIFKANFVFSKNYLRSLLPQILFSTLIFSSGIIAGYYFFSIFPSESEKVISLLKEVYKPILEMPKIAQILFIFLKNGLVSFFIIITGIIFGIFPIVALVSNGEVLGLLLGLTIPKYNIFYILSGILPHGIIEIPCFLISSAIGLKIGKTLTKKIFRKGGSLKDELNLGLVFFLKIILVFLFLAAILEVLVSSELLRH